MDAKSADTSITIRVEKEQKQQKELEWNTRKIERRGPYIEKYILRKILYHPFLFSPFCPKKCEQII
jgi:hypothetical protein